MKALFAFIQKEFRHIIRDYRTLMVLIGMPLAQVLLFGYAITTEIHHAEIAVYDRSGDELSRKFLTKIDASDYFTISNQVYSVRELENVFRKGKVKLGILLPSDFSKEVISGGSKIELIADGSDPNMAGMLVNYLSMMTQQFSREENLFPSGGILIEPHFHLYYNPQQKSVYLFVPGVITVILMLISAMLTAIALSREKELGNMEVLLVSPMSPAVIVVGKVIPYLLLSLIIAGLVLMAGHFVFGVPLNGNATFLLAECILFVVCALSLGILISIVSTSQQMALMLSLFALMLPTILLSGFIFPISSMPWPLQWISAVIPARYFNELLKGIMLKGIGIEFLWKQTLILCGMTLFFILLSIKKFRIRTQ